MIRTRITTYLLFSILAGTLLLTGCSITDLPGISEPDEVDTALTVTDALGREVALDGPPERIVIAGKANFFLNDALYTFHAAPERVVGLTKARQTTKPFLSLLDPDFEEKMRFTVDSTAEEIATAEPDLVVLKRFMRESVGSSLETLGIPVIYLDFETPDQYHRDLGTVGTVFDNPARAEALQAYYADKQQRIADELAAVPEADRPRTLVVQYTTQGGSEAFRVPPQRWMQTQMTELAGGLPVWREQSEGGWSVVNLEQIAAWNPNAVFVISYFDPVGEVVDRLTSDPQWQSLSAVDEGRIYGFPGDFYSWDQPDTRWILGLTWMASRLHPETFAEVDMRAEVFEFYSTLYDLDAETVESEVLPLVQGDVTVR